MAFLWLGGPAIALDPSTSLADYARTTWTHKDGLPSTFVRSIAQTAEGYIWLGTTDGLVRFDGIRFVQWRPKSGDLRPLGTVQALCAARDGTIWTGSRSGIVGHLRDENLSSSNTGAPVQAILQARDGGLWVATENRLLRYLSGPEITVTAEYPLSAGWLSGPLQDPSGSIWISTQDGVEELRSGSGVNGLTMVLPGRFWLSQDADRTIQATRGDGLTEPLNKISASPRFRGGFDILTTLHDSRGNNWLGTRGMGLVRAQSSLGADPEIFRTGPGNDYVWSLFEDREHNLWVGTQNGLTCFRDGRFRTLTVRDGLVSDNVDALAAGADGSIWAATSLGLNRIDGAHRDLYLPGTKVMGVGIDSRNHLWAGTSAGFVRLTNGRPDSFAWPAGLRLTSVTAIAIDSRDNVWLADAARGLYRWSGGHVDDFPNEPLLRGKSIVAAEADRRGRVWFGFYEAGIAVFENGSFRAYSEGDGLSAGSVTSILPEDNGVTWISTQAGLTRFDGTKFVAWTTADGLPGNRVLWVLNDRSQDQLWLGFSFGIARIRKSELDAAARQRTHRVEYDLFDNGDGLRGNPDHEWQSPAVQTSDGTIWFRTSDGVAIIDPRRLKKNPVLPPVQIESMVADGVRLNLANALRLRPLTRDIRFDYTALSLVEPRRVRFRYMLEGYDSAWQDAGTRRQAFYTNLSPRRYRFRVLACNNDGVWNEAGASLPFALLAAFYQTSWFALLCLIALGMLSWSAYRLRVWQLTSRLRTRYEERLSERTRIAQELHDNLLQSVLGISLQLEVTDELLPPDSAARKPLEHALVLSREAMAEGRRALNDLRTQTLGEDALVQAFSQVANDFPVAELPEIQILTEGQERPLNGLAGNDVLQIGRQAIVNAFQHSHAERIQVLLSYSRQSLCVRVNDNGIGIDENTLNLGRPGHHGIAGMRERAARVGASLSIFSRADEGTEVCLNVPGHLIYEVQDRNQEYSRS